MAKGCLPLYASRTISLETIGTAKIVDECSPLEPWIVAADGENNVNEQYEVCVRMSGVN